MATKGEPPAEQLGEVIVKQPAHGRVGDDPLQVLRSGPLRQLLDRLDAHRAKQRVGCLVEHRNDRARQHEIEQGRAGQCAGQRHGSGDRQVLWTQFAEHHLHGGAEDQRDGQR